MSFWVSIVVVVVDWNLGTMSSVFDFNYVYLIGYVILVYRGSNVIHGAIDKYFEARRDIRYHNN